MTDKNNASFAYGVNMLRLLLSMKLISREEYKRIVKIQTEYYGVRLCLTDDYLKTFFE